VRNCEECEADRGYSTRVHSSNSGPFNTKLILRKLIHLNLLEVKLKYKYVYHTDILRKFLASVIRLVIVNRCVLFYKIMLFF
jgi:hypothetical protein